ncbi:perilipin-3 [Caerostris darwini]|uniref:Perilipin-3 n=1 Tax=Caerostris darwini TaxID=1538125 RepID=A0AAV4WHV7_9ARAC|nr:perilipin-3 [Caerostris darwini]
MEEVDLITATLEAAIPGYGDFCVGTSFVVDHQIIGDTRKLYVDTVNSRLGDIKKYGNDTVKSAADFGIKQATAIFGKNLVNSVLTSVDDVLVLTLSYLDHILPPSKDEKQSNGPTEETDKQSGLVRLSKLYNALRKRAHQGLLLQIEYIQEKSFDLFLIYPIRLIEISKTNLDSAVEYANKLWAAIWKQEVAEADEAEKNRIEQQLLLLARLVSKQVAATYTSIYPSPSETDGTSDTQELHQAPAALVAVRDGAMWVMGMIKLIPQLLPMYLYGLALWLEEIRNRNKRPVDEKEEEVKENGSAQKDRNHSTHDHSHENNIHASNEDSGIDGSISEENQD